MYSIHQVEALHSVVERYFSSTVEVQVVSDVLDGRTNQPFNRREWRWFIKKLHKEHTDERPSRAFLGALYGLLEVGYVILAGKWSSRTLNIMPICSG